MAAAAAALAVAVAGCGATPICYGAPAYYMSIEMYIHRTDDGRMPLPPGAAARRTGDERHRRLDRAEAAPDLLEIGASGSRAPLSLEGQRTPQRLIPAAW